MVSLRWRRRASPSPNPPPRRVDPDRDQIAFVTERNLQYAVQKGDNSGLPTYQDISGAPVEARSPLGYHVGSITIVFLNLSAIVGTGVYSTPAAVLQGTGSVGLALVYWLIGLLSASAALSVYLEYASYFPSRSGSLAVYLEQAYPRPRYLVPVTFAVQTVLLCFSASNAIVLARYLVRINGHAPTPWEQKSVAVAGYTVVVLLVAFHTRFAYRLSNAIGIVKLLTLIFVAVTGLVVLGGHTSVPNPTANFQGAFDSTTTSAYGVTSALVKIIFSYKGFENAFNVVNEVKNPVRSIRNSAGVSLLLIGVLYMLANVAYFAAVPLEDLKESTQIAASLFFQRVFGTSRAVKGLNFLIALSAFGNLISVLLGDGRLIRECGRQGTLPYAPFWVSTRPFGTPLGPYATKWIMTILILLAVPAGDAFNFVVDLEIYPTAFFTFLMALGLYLVRYRRRKLGLARLPSKEGGFRAWEVAVLFTIAVNLYLLVMPWYPPTSGATGGDVSFWYAAYVVAGIGIVVACAVYYTLWVWILPHYGRYRIRQERLVLEGGEVTHKLTKVPLERVQAWDEGHDGQGRQLNTDASSKDESTAVAVPMDLLKGDDVEHGPKG